MTGSPFVAVGRVLSGLVVAYTALDAVLKLAGHPDLLQAGIDPALPVAAPLTGLALLAAALLYALPRTASLGAILLTGGLVASAVARIDAGDPDPSRLLFGLYVGLLMWMGLLLRRPGLRNLLLGASH